MSHGMPVGARRDLDALDDVDRAGVVVLVSESPRMTACQLAMRTRP